MALSFLRTLRVLGTGIQQSFCFICKKSSRKSRCCRYWLALLIASTVLLQLLSPVMAQQPWKDYGTKTVSSSTSLNQSGATAKFSVTLVDTARVAALYLKISLSAWLRASAVLEFDKLTGTLADEPSALVHFFYWDTDSNAVAIVNRPLLDLVQASGNKISFNLSGIPSGHTLNEGNIVVHCEGIVIIDHVPLRLAEHPVDQLSLELPKPLIGAEPTLVMNDFELVYYPATEEEEIVIIDTMGQLRWSGSLQPGEHLTVESSAWPAGLYYVLTGYATQAKVQAKLMKQ